MLVLVSIANRSRHCFAAPAPPPPMLIMDPINPLRPLNDHESPAGGCYSAVAQDYPIIHTRPVQRRDEEVKEVMSRTRESHESESGSSVSDSLEGQYRRAGAAQTPLPLGLVLVYDDDGDEGKDQDADSKLSREVVAAQGQSGEEHEKDQKVEHDDDREQKSEHDEKGDLS